VPDGVLFGSSNAHRALREKLLNESELQAVISLPGGVFKPYAGVSTAVLVFVKGGTTERVWFYDLTNDGYSLDDKRERVQGSDLPDLIARWRARDPQEHTDRTAKAFFVPVEELRDNKLDLSINRYKQVKYATVAHEPPKVILGRLRELEGEILAGIERLEGMLG
jgi:type I restriction enzyme M protein